MCNLPLWGQRIAGINKSACVACSPALEAPREIHFAKQSPNYVPLPTAVLLLFCITLVLKCQVFREAPSQSGPCSLVASCFFSSIFSLICPCPSEPFKEIICQVKPGRLCGARRCSPWVGGVQPEEPFLPCPRPSFHPWGPTESTALTTYQLGVVIPAAVPSGGLSGAGQKARGKACHLPAQSTALGLAVTDPGVPQKQ